METGQDRELTFVEGNGLQLAAIAWGEYQKHGRGALLIPADIIGAPSGAMGKIVYVPLSQLEATASARGVSQSDLDAIREYDPSCACVLVFLRNPEEPVRIVTFEVKESRSLPQIYEQIKEQWSRSSHN